MKRLTPKQERFCLEFVQSFNATQSYLKVYGGTNKASAQSASSRLLSKDIVQAEIKKLQEFCPPAN